MRAHYEYRGQVAAINYTMAKVEVTNVTVLDNPTAFNNPFQFEVTFECFEDLPSGMFYIWEGSREKKSTFL